MIVTSFTFEYPGQKPNCDIVGKTTNNKSGQKLGKASPAVSRQHNKCYSVQAR